MKTSDLVTIPPVRTVIRLADLGDSSLRRHLVESFIFTGEVSFAIATILKKIAVARGEGFFIIGNYGSGKSHLLNTLSLAIGDSEARQMFIASSLEGGGPESDLPALLEKVAAKIPLIVEISLVEHSSRENLEQIVLKAVTDRLPDRGKNEKSATDTNAELPRREAFALFKQRLAEENHGGLLLLIDELSEFLRSKDNPRAYNEDIRFLQYLGEFAESIPAWIIATMQENIENTGSLTGELLHKIKDRYPVRFQLSGQHVKEIVSGRLVRKQAGAEAKLQEIYNTLQSAFTRLPFSREDFISLYPVHPATVEMLDELRPIFSQHRGVIDFIHFRLAGDPARGIETFIDRPAEELLTPDQIFDHFRDRLRETVETSPYSEQVFHHYEREVGRLFDDQDDACIALRLIRLLILGAIARAPRSFSARELAMLLLHRYSSLESSINYEYISELMNRIVSHGAYISTHEKDNETHFTIDLKADVGLLLEKKIEKLKKELQPGDRRVIDTILAWADDSYLPLKELQQEQEQDIEVTWQNTGRSGKIIFRSPAESDHKTLTSLKQDLADAEKDFIFFITPPATGHEESGSSNPWQVLFETFSEELRRCLALWIPRQISNAEEEILHSAYAHKLLADEYTADNSPVGKQINRQLNLLLGEEKNRVKELFRKIYLQGHLRVGDQRLSPSSMGYLPFVELINRIAADILKERYPRHAEIRPLGEQVSGSLMQRTLDLLFTPELEADELERGIRLVIENYVSPLGLVKKKGQGFQLQINPKNSPLTAEFLACLPEEGRVTLNQIYRNLRQGPFGLSKTGFQVLGMAIILSGAVSAYQGGKHLTPSQINYYRFWNIEEVGPGTLIRPELEKVLGEVPFLPLKLRSKPLTFAAQQQIWEAVIGFKVEWTNKSAEIRRQVEKLEGHPSLSVVNWDHIRKTIDRLQAFLSEVKTSYASREGLERFLAAYQSSPLFSSDWQRLNAIDYFFSSDLPEILRIAAYLRNERLVIPAGEKFSALDRRRRLLNDLLGEEALIWEEKYRERLKREFNQFRGEYSTLYLAEHNETVGPQRIKPYRALTETTPYRLLEQLGQINTLVVDNDLVAVNRQLSRALEKECSVLDEIGLQESAACSCGYSLGEEVTLPDREKIEKEILLGVKAYLQALQASEVRQKLEAHANHLELVGRRREAEPLNKLLHLDTDSPPDRLSEKVKELLKSPIVNIINQALTGNAIIAERSLDDLQELLENRVFHHKQLQDLFQTWLNRGDSTPPAYIRVSHKQTIPSGDRSDRESPGEKGLAPLDYLESKQPQLPAVASRIGAEKVFALALLYGWFSHYKLQAEGDTLIRKLAEEDAAKALLTGELTTALESLGSLLLTDRHELKASFLEKAAEKAVLYISATEMLELYLKKSGAQLHRFETLLDFFIDEPFFPALSREAATRLAVQISAEESVPQLSIIAGILRETARSSAREPVGLTESHYLHKAEALEVLQTAAEGNLILHEAEAIAASPPENDKNWERLYKMIYPFELSLGRLEESSSRNLIPEVITRRWRRRFISSLESLEQAFSDYLEHEAPPRRQTLRSLLQKIPQWVSKESGVRGLYFIIIDGARLDTWNVLLELALKTYPFHTLREGLLWADQPTVTETQLQPLKEAGLLGHMLNMNENLLAELVADPTSFLDAVENRIETTKSQPPIKAIKFSFVDDKIHTSRDPLPQLIEELSLSAKKQFHPLLEYIPPAAVVLMAADHGFKTNYYHDKQRKEEPLYLHGGDSFFETLAPWVLLRKRGPN